ncbi:MAG: dihydrofolate reductase [Janthinobacterium lividum]
MTQLSADAPDHGTVQTTCTGAAAPGASLTIIVATDRQRGIGVANTLPWRLPEDMAYFKRTTTGHPVIMGRKTFDSIGRALPNRRNIVITRNSAWSFDGVETAPSLEAAANMVGAKEAFLIGGAQIYAAALPLALTRRLLVTEIDAGFDCDAFFPAIDSLQWKEVQRETHHSDQAGFDYSFVCYERRQTPGK